MNNIVFDKIIIIMISKLDNYNDNTISIFDLYSIISDSIDESKVNIKLLTTDESNVYPYYYSLLLRNKIISEIKNSNSILFNLHKLGIRKAKIYSLYE